MRLLAHLYPDHSSPIITVHEALRLQRQNPEELGRTIFLRSYRAEVLAAD
jgi:hypothetical protein